MKYRRAGGIGRALGLRRARLGMRIAGSGDPNEEGPPPGSKEFGIQADRRRRRLLGLRDLKIEKDESLEKYRGRRT